MKIFRGKLYVDESRYANLPLQVNDIVVSDTEVAVNTVSELSAAVDEDPSFSVTIRAEIAAKVFSAVDITYVELINHISASTLVPGQTYKITDYATVYNMPNVSPVEVIVCGIEPIMVTAIHINKLSPIAFSPAFPQDVIYYHVDNDQTAVPGCTKGYISRRIDTLKSNDIGFDYRNVKFRRWQIDVTDVDATGAVSNYTKGQVIKKTGTVEIYIKLNDDAAKLFTDTSSWKRFEWDNLQYVSPTIDVWCPIDGSLQVLIPCSALYTDYKMFSTVPTISGVESSYDTITNNTIESNTVAIDKINSVIFGNGFANNVIGSGFTKNVIGSGFTKNVIGNNFSYSTIGSGFTNNAIGNGFSNNTIGINFYDNSIENGFNTNTIGSNFNTNTIGSSSYNNSIGTNFNNNSIGSNFFDNTIGSTFYDNSIGNSFYYNSIGSSFYYNTIESNFSDNTIGNFFYNNSLGSSFTESHIGDYFNTNSIGNGFYFSTIGNYSQYNSIGASFTTNVIGTNFSNNVIGANFSFFTIETNMINNTIASSMIQNGTYHVTIGNNFQNNIIPPSCIDAESAGASIDLSAATFCYATQTKYWFKTPSNLLKLYYFADTTFAMTVVDITD